MRWRLLQVVLHMALLAGWLCACARTPGPASTPVSPTPRGDDLQQQAAAEATAIIQRAEATAMVLQAQAQATALVRQAQTPVATLSLPVPSPALPGPTPGAAGLGDRGTATPEATEAGEAPDTVEGAPAVELVSVGFGAEGALIVVNYRASPAAAQKFWPGVLSVTDETTGTVFNEVPVMPVIGPLIARPREPGQLGYVMLVHAPAILRSGSLVTVVLDTFKQEHVPVQ